MTERPDELDREADEWLVRKATSDGGIDAYEVLIRRHRDRIYRIALRMTGNTHDADDVAQDIVLQLWTALAGFVGDSSFTTWLYRIVVNRCLNHIKRRRNDDPILDPDVATSPGADAQAVARARARATMAALTALPPDLRAPIVLHEIEQLSYQEVATILNLSEPTVRGRLHRGRRRLAEAMQEWT
ncbi:RNA polymerase sigma factor [Pseudonocardia sp. KRD291]|uniref:RNA polymerase sigma factor n=1 Tax=Pseudonocardia sp. KRD291 TaxID=2792007 RepID=UPI001C49D2C2|nr:RNA polymerase sigma factor [Pseudonocardia sp. KRD291]MBW0102892.1 RNA polymerase sigma factor [Pseudonocardia sp. KRD291]